MRLPTLILAAAAAVAAVTPAMAGARISDPQYVRAGRCLGLTTAPTLGAADAAALDKLFKAQGRGRDPHIRDRASDAQMAAATEARRADPEGRAVLIAERDGVCKALSPT